MSQCSAILAHLKAGNTITPAQAYERFGSLALHSRISELRDVGYRIEMELRSAGGKRWGEYRLAQPQQGELVPHV